MIQIFGTPKCKNTKKAERFFRERRIPFQLINLFEKEMSPREFQSVVKAVGGIENLIDRDSRDYSRIAWLSEEDIPEKLTAEPQLMKTPVVRNGAGACCGYQPDCWKKFCTDTVK
ncbi:MAG: ArsC family transcriptional regulator [Treponema sp.]|jgi:arsenate reductase-like glutaredoxin family protein|nr:ArsC family transcriptional regulator [Treponema sp.]